VGIKPKRLPYFKVGKELKEKINGSSFSPELKDIASPSEPEVSG
jgi:hypothetical protein